MIYTCLRYYRQCNPDRLLVPGGYVTLLTDFAQPPSYLSLPQQCIVDLSGGSLGVWVVKDDSTVEQRVVEVKVLEMVVQIKHRRKKISF